MERSGGVLLHPTSLPGRYGIGDLGPAAYAWVDALARAGQSWWQILPLSLTGAGDSPYQGFSALGGDVLLLSPERLAADGLIDASVLASMRLADGLIDYGAVRQLKENLLARSWNSFQAGAGGLELHREFQNFCDREAGWLKELAFFLALKEEHGGHSWFDWPTPLVLRRPAALEQARVRLRDSIGRHEFGQFLFWRQWRDLKAYAHQHGIRLIGDLPIFVAADSVDVWANPELFQLDQERRLRVLAGVPPDYFSPTGQRWGNPHYDWAAMRATDYAWWIKRLRGALAQVDLIRLDHFRGFAAAWEIPPDSPTAEKGRWVEGPGAELFDKLSTALGQLPLIAEDLGVITPDVEALRLRYELPGMRVLQFTFGPWSEERFLPHNFSRHTVVYTGTHDNDTSVGWFATLSPADARAARRYFPPVEANIAWDLIRAAWASVADLAITPVQDLLGLGTAARMNYPGRPEGNWRWRFTEGALTDELLARLHEWTEVYGRLPASRPLLS
jgi:4-alpha-glucanotransferase